MGTAGQEAGRLQCLMSIPKATTSTDLKEENLTTF